MRGREWRTGGDIAFILDITEYASEPRWLALCLQGKRVKTSNGGVVGIASSGEDGANQVRRLAALQADQGVNSAYLFYDNSGTEVQPLSSAPLVKGIDHLLEAGETSLSVNLRKDTVDLASYILRLASDMDRSVDENELEGMLGSLMAADISHLVTVNTDQERHSLLLESAWNLGFGQNLNPLKTGDIDFSAIRKAPEIEWDKVPQLAARAKTMKFTTKVG